MIIIVLNVFFFA